MPRDGASCKAPAFDRLRQTKSAVPDRLIIDTGLIEWNIIYPNEEVILDAE